MIKVLAVVISILISSTVLGADMTAVGRFTATGGRDIGLITKYGEVWTLGIEQPHPTIEVGKVVPAGKAYLGGYLSYWVGSGQFYAEPFGLIIKDMGDVRFKTKGFAYLPLNGGKASFGSDEISLTCKIGKNVRMGGIIHFWKVEGETALTAAGLQIEWRLGSKTSLTLRETEGSLGQIRLAVCQSF